MTRLADAIIIVCASGAAVQAGVLEGAELLVASAHLADVFLIAAGTVRYGARYTCCSVSAGLLCRCCAGRARDRRRLSQANGGLRGALLAIGYAPVCRVAAEGADLFLASLVSGGEVSAILFACSFSNTLRGSGRRISL